MKNSLLILFFLILSVGSFSQNSAKDYAKNLENFNQRKKELEKRMAKKESDELIQKTFIVMGIILLSGALVYVIASTKYSKPKSSTDELTVKQTDIYKVMLIIVLPLLITFLLEHMQKVQPRIMVGVPGIHSITFETFFGNTITENDRSVLSNVEYNYDGLPYNEKLTYYFQGLIKDIIYPISLSIISLILFIFKKRYKINIQ